MKIKIEMKMKILIEMKIKMKMEIKIKIGGLAASLRFLYSRYAQPGRFLGRAG